MYESNHPFRKRGFYTRNATAEGWFFFFQGRVYITDEKACLIIKYEPEEHGFLEGVLV